MGIELFSVLSAVPHIWKHGLHGNLLFLADLPFLGFSANGFLGFVVAAVAKHPMILLVRMVHRTSAEVVDVFHVSGSVLVNGVLCLEGTAAVTRHAT